MRWYLRSGVLMVGLTVMVSGAALVRAQDSAEATADTEEASERWHFYLELSAWIAQPTGLEYSVATLLDPSNSLSTQYVNPEESTAAEPYFRMGFELPGNGGDFVLTYFAHEQNNSLSYLTPGAFVYGEINTSGYLSGVFNNGLADGLQADTRTKLQDIRLDYYRTAFDTKSARGKWFVGYRRVSHLRNLNTSYYALAPNLPPVMPPVSNPIPGLVPRPDTAGMKSEWEGRGLQAGLDVKLPLPGNKVWFETGLAVSVLRGKITTRYVSTTNFYARTNGDSIDQILQPPYDEFNDPVAIAEMEQLAADVGIQNESEGRDAFALEAWLELRWRFWKYTEFLLGFRNIEYSDVGKDLRTERVTPNREGTVDGTKADGTRYVRLLPQTVESTDHSANYEGFYIGLGFRY